MELIEQLAEAALQRDSLRLRSLVQDIVLQKSFFHQARVRKGEGVS